MKRIFVLLVVMASVTFMQAQKLKGDLSPLSGQKELNVVFVYDGVTYDGDSEAKFFKKNDDHDDFEQWKKDWTGEFRTNMWEPEMLKDWNNEMSKLQAGNYPNAKYTAIVKITDIDPGSFAGPFSQPCKLTGTITFVPTGSADSFAIITFSDVAGNGYQMTPVVEHRVKFAFSELGEEIGEICNKKIK